MNDYQQVNQARQSYSDPVSRIPEEYRPISMWGYFGYQLLFGIPCIGLIFLIVFALGGTSNVNLKNFARSYFCLFILMIVITVIFTVVGIMAAGGLSAFMAMLSEYGGYSYY